MGRKMDDTYILKAAQIALSLAKFLQNNRSEDVSSCINCEYYSCKQCHGEKCGQRGGSVVEGRSRNW